MKCIILFLTIFLTYEGEAKMLEEKVQELTDLTEKISVLSLTVQKFQEYVIFPPKDYSTIIIFTAMAPTRGCAICAEVYNEYLILANSYRFSEKFNKDVFFSMVDVEVAPEVFKLLGVRRVPGIIHFPASGKPTGADIIDLERTGFHAEGIAKWITSRTNIQIDVIHPPDYTTVIVDVVVVVLLVGLIYIFRNNLEIIYNKDLWAAGAVFFCFVMTSGQMWNYIVDPMMYLRTKHGPVYISDADYQFKMESYFVATLYAVVVLGFILIIEAAGGIKSNKIRIQGDGKWLRIQCIVGLVLVCVVFSLLLTVFAAKTHEYPFRFLL